MQHSKHSLIWGSSRCSRTCRPMAKLGRRNPLTFACRKVSFFTRPTETLAPLRFLEPLCFASAGLRVATLEHGPLRFPADGKLSLDIKAAGYWCAWSDRYYVRNVGHEVVEFEADPVYYRENYANKPWLGIEGWERRVALQKTLPKLNRASIILADRWVGAQRGGNAVVGKSARLWSSFDAVTPTVETIEFLYSLTRLAFLPVPRGIFVGSIKGKK